MSNLSRRTFLRALTPAGVAWAAGVLPTPTQAEQVATSLGLIPFIRTPVNVVVFVPKVMDQVFKASPILDLLKRGGPPEGYTYDWLEETPEA